jgi:hypothetical protein
MSSLSFGSLALRLATCILVTYVAVTVLGLIGWPITAPIWGVMFAKPILEFFPALQRMVHRHAFLQWESKYFKYEGIHLRAYFDGDDVWFDAKDVLSVLDKKPGSWLETRFTPREYGVIPCRKEKGFSIAGVVKLTKISDHPEASKFQLWFERTVVFNLNRKKEMRETHGNPGL